MHLAAHSPSWPSLLLPWDAYPNKVFYLGTIGATPRLKYSAQESATRENEIEDRLSRPQKVYKLVEVELAMAKIAMAEYVNWKVENHGKSDTYATV